jgi:peptidoglycan/xylan/chitin deacetylase (PgdA/CDA1 family)
MKSSKDIKRNDHTSNDSIDIRRQKRARERRRKQRRKKYMRRRILALLVLLILVFAIVKIVSSIFKKPKDISLDGPLPAWYAGMIYQEKYHDFYRSPKNYTDKNQKLLSVYDRATELVKELVPGSNHITTASSYAYNTGEIRKYIRGEANYTDPQKLVFLTFDDGPNTSVTPQILDILNKNDVHATFFVVGQNISDKTSPVLKKMLMSGNAIATHSFSHQYEDLYPGKNADASKIIEEYKLTQNRLENVFGEKFKSNVWRYPGGHMSWSETTQSDAILKENGVEWIDWNCLTGDAEPGNRGPKSEADFVRYLDRSLNKNVHTNVAVVLMHDEKTKNHTVNTLQAVIDYFKENDYKFCILK